jgi:hypothetical protein
MSAREQLHQLIDELGEDEASELVGQLPAWRLFRAKWGGPEYGPRKPPPGYAEGSTILIADAETAKRAQDAIRDILYLYRELVAYGGVVGDHTIGSFDPWEFVRAAAYGGWAIDEDLKLLHEGSAVALLCDLLDEMEQRGSEMEMDRFRQGLEAGLLDHLPLAKEALRAGLKGPDAVREAAGPVYREYVLGYLSTLVE